MDNLVGEKKHLAPDVAPAADSSAAAPPSYTSTAPTEFDGSSTLPPSSIPEDLTQRLSKLRLDGTSDQARTSHFITEDQCVAHLKLLESFYRLRQDVSEREGIFAINDADATVSDTSGEATTKRAQLVREKRWEVYVARAVDRFQTWWERCVPNTRGGETRGHCTVRKLQVDPGIDQIALAGKPMFWSKESLPPLDVLMVWHSYLLNPRAFFEDCIRWGKMDWYATGLPWPSIDFCIDNVTFEYNTPAQARTNFETATGRKWDNLEESLDYTLTCPSCKKTSTVPWTSQSGYRTAKSEFKPGVGYADRDFEHVCYCGYVTSHESLRVLKFRNDMSLLLTRDVPLPGTILGLVGAPETPLPTRRAGRFADRHPFNLFPSTFIKTKLRSVLLDHTDPQKTHGRTTMATIRDQITVNLAYERPRPIKLEKIAIRKMMSRYWFNHSPFALDLSGAVIRQGSFVEKMHNIDWLHSPALLSTTSRLMTKYERFFAIMAANPSKVACPTLDVDLAWHTHQLSPQVYYRYSAKLTQKLIDHDDKMEESDLNNAFAWTSKTYQSMFGEPYSQCTCWYCEAIRESHTSSLDRVIRPKNRVANDSLHADQSNYCDLSRAPHISAHNAVKDQRKAAQRRVEAAKLDKNYHSACSRARKKGYPEPQRDVYFAYAWGYPMMMPIYYPYAVDPCVNGGDGVYANDPCNVDTNSGAYGSCVAGTCGGAASYGGAACAGNGGSCGSGGGACGGGGGGGGCGGGGGGCGGGGGGGGGCGGGGGGG